jgi:hypothetical protein
MSSILKTGTIINSRRDTFLPGIFLLVAVSGLQGCTPAGTGPVISDLEFGDLTPRPADYCQPHNGPDCATDLQEFPSYAELGKTIRVLPLGTGTCGAISIDFGDGTPPVVQNLQLGTAANPGPGVLHTYTGWPGRKLVHVKGISGCLGDQSKQIMVARAPVGRGEFELGFVPTLMVCNVVPNLPPLRKGVGVRIFADALIKYGPFIEFGASGEPNTSAPAAFPFPGFRKFSVIYRVGSQVVQGEADYVPFKVLATAPLEICLNDIATDLGDNSGAGRFVITVNEVSAE